MTEAYIICFSLCGLQVKGIILHYALFLIKEEIAAVEAVLLSTPCLFYIVVVYVPPPIVLVIAILQSESDFF